MEMLVKKKKKILGPLFLGLNTKNSLSFLAIFYATMSESA
jgi:hypothetical protein